MSLQQNTKCEPQPVDLFNYSFSKPLSELWLAENEWRGLDLRVFSNFLKPTPPGVFLTLFEPNGSFF